MYTTTNLKSNITVEYCRTILEKKLANSTALLEYHDKILALFDTLEGLPCGRELEKKLKQALGSHVSLEPSMGNICYELVINDARFDYGAGKIQLCHVPSGLNRGSSAGLFTLENYKAENDGRMANVWRDKAEAEQLLANPRLIEKMVAGHHDLIAQISNFNNVLLDSMRFLQFHVEDRFKLK